MPRLALFNMFFGFLVLTLAAMMGPFLATEITAGYLRDHALLGTWKLLLQKSSHGHTNLFGTLQVLFGLTLPYSALAERWKKLQTAGFIFGVVGMSIGMQLRAAVGPVEGIDPTEVLVGGCLTAALVALATHTFGLAMKTWRRA